MADAKVRQTVTAAFPAVAWMSEHLATDAAQRDAFHAGVAAVYRPRLERLGFAPRPGEPDEDALMRAALVDFMGLQLRDPDVRSHLARLGNAVLGVDADGVSAPDAAPRDLRGAALAVALQAGGAEAFAIAERHLRATQDAVLRAELLGAMGATADPSLDARVRALVDEPGLLRRNEVLVAVGGQARHASTRAALRAWLDAGFARLEARLSPAGAGLVALYAEGMCSEAESQALESTFGERMTAVEGGPRELQQTREAIALCAAQKAARTGLAIVTRR
jgi:alanyl aminopeptidase